MPRKPLDEETRKRMREIALKNSPIVQKGPEFAAECGRKCGEAKRQKSAERKKIKDDLNMLLKLALKKGDIVNGEDILNLEEAQNMNVNVQTAINIAMIKRAMLGDVQAAQYIRDTLGEKPSDKVEVDQSLTIESWAKNHKVKL